MKKILSIALAAAMMAGMTGCSSGQAEADKLEQIKEAGKIVLGTSPDFPPNEFYILDENGEKQIVGSDIALGQAIADEIGVELEIKPTDFNGVLANVQSGTVDMAISGFAQTEERKQVMQFSDGYQRDDSDDYQGILTTKENAEKLALFFGVDLSECIAVGDNYNDLPMLEVAGLSVAAGNAVEDVKKVCDVVTKADNNEGVIAEIVERFIL